MNDAVQVALAFFAGAVLGGVFFVGLWWTLRKGLSARQPALWFGASLLVRVAIVVTGFYLVAGSSWQRLLLCLLGFIVARQLVTRRIRAGEGSHAP